MTVLSALVTASAWASTIAAPTPSPTPNPGTEPYAFAGAPGNDSLVEDLAGLAVDGAKNYVLHGLVDGMTKGFVHQFEQLTTWWVGTGSTGPALASHDSILAITQRLTGPLTYVVATIGVVIAGTRMAVAGTRGQEAGRDLLRGLLLLSVFGVGSAAIVSLLRGAFDTAAAQVISSSLQDAPTSMEANLDGLAASFPGLMVFLLPLGILSGLFQWVTILLREPVLALLTGLLPVAAGASMTGVGRAWLMKLLSWIAAFVSYKFVAAVIYAAAFEAIRSATTLSGVITGITLVVIAVAALPAMIRLLTPAVMAMQGGGGGGALAAAGAVATGAIMLSGRGSTGAGDDQPSQAGPRTTPGLAPGTSLVPAPRAGIASSARAASSPPSSPPSSPTPASPSPGSSGPPDRPQDPGPSASRSGPGEPPSTAATPASRPALSASSTSSSGDAAAPSAGSATGASHGSSHGSSHGVADVGSSAGAGSTTAAPGDGAPTGAGATAPATTSPGATAPTGAGAAGPGAAGAGAGGARAGGPAGAVAMGAQQVVDGAARARQIVEDAAGDTPENQP